MKLTTWSIIARFFFDRVSFASWSWQISFWFIEIGSAVAVSGAALSSLKFSVFIDPETFQKISKNFKRFSKTFSNKFSKKKSKFSKKKFD